MLHETLLKTAPFFQPSKTKLCFWRRIFVTLGFFPSQKYQRTLFNEGSVIDFTGKWGHSRSLGTFAILKIQPSSIKSKKTYSLHLKIHIYSCDLFEPLLKPKAEHSPRNIFLRGRTLISIWCTACMCHIQRMKHDFGGWNGKHFCIMLKKKNCERNFLGKETRSWARLFSLTLSPAYCDLLKFPAPPLFQYWMKNAGQENCWQTQFTQYGMGWGDV